MDALVASLHNTHIHSIPLINPHVYLQFPADVVARAKAYLAAQPMGAYSNSQVRSCYIYVLIHVCV